MKNGIYVVATPIGNTKDITLHALNILQNAAIILCEDTRKANSLLKQYEITGKKLLIFTEYSSAKEISKFLNLAKESAVAIVSDAGTPLVCDPGYEILHKARELDIPIMVAVGACAFIAAATLCGVNICNTLFLGFFQKHTKLDVERTNALYVAPHDVISFIKSLEQYNDHKCNISIARELTKEFEEVLFFTSSQKALDFFTRKNPLGEFTIFVKFQPLPQSIHKEVVSIVKELNNWESLPRKSFARFLQKNFFKTIPTKEVYTVLNNIS